jgi:hypothetical protein
MPEVMIVIVNGPCGIGKSSSLAFRDALRTKLDRATYSDSKGVFVQKVLEVWGAHSGCHSD